MLTIGVDVSRWNWPVPWPKLRKRGIEFAGVRATIGASGLDQRYQQHRAHIEAADITMAPSTSSAGKSPSTTEAPCSPRLPIPTRFSSKTR